MHALEIEFHKKGLSQYAITYITQSKGLSATLMAIFRTRNQLQSFKLSRLRFRF